MNCIYAKKTDKWRLYGMGKLRECCCREEVEFLMSTFGYPIAVEASCGRYQLLMPKNTSLTLAVRRCHDIWRVMYPPYVFPDEWKLKKDAINWIRDTFGNVDKTVAGGVDWTYVTVGKVEKTP